MKPLLAKNQRLIREIRALKAMKVQEYRASADKAAYEHWKATVDARIAQINKSIRATNALQSTNVS